MITQSVIKNGLTYRQNKEGDGYPITRIETISDEKIDPTRVGFVNNLKEEELREYRLIVGDILFSHINSLEHIGKTAIYEAVPEVLLHGMNLLLLRPNKQKIEPYFLLYLLRLYRTVGIFKNMAKKAVNQASINQTELKRVRISLPPLEEQQKIAQVLMSIDKAIEAVDEAIAKAERIKKGLMQELLTKGIGHREFKGVKLTLIDTEIPENWEIVKLRDIITDLKSGFASGKRDENGILQLRMDSIDLNGRINPNAGVKVPIPKNVEEYLLKPGDILFNNTNSVDLIGKTAIFRGEFARCVYSNHLTRIRVNPEKTIPEWLLYVMIRYWQLGIFKAICHQHVHQAGINSKDLLNLKIPLPPLEEQQKIAEILSKWDEVIEMKKAKKDKLERMKKKVMELLLTGKVRVK